MITIAGYGIGRLATGPGWHSVGNGLPRVTLGAITGMEHEMSWNLDNNIGGTFRGR